MEYGKNMEGNYGIKLLTYNNNDCDDDKYAQPKSKVSVMRSKPAYGTNVYC